MMDGPVLDIQMYHIVAVKLSIAGQRQPDALYVLSQWKRDLGTGDGPVEEV